MSHGNFDATRGRKQEYLPKQNRPLVRDGRLQVPAKKRTDRSYLPTSPKPADSPSDPESEIAESVATSPEAALDAARAPVSAPAATATGPARATVPARLPTAVRAIQQQGVRKKRDLDPHELAERDTKYAIHELRRIVVLAVLIIATLIILGVVLR